MTGAIFFLKAEFDLSPFWFGAVTGSAILDSVYIDGWIALRIIAAFWLIRTFSRRSILMDAFKDRFGHPGGTFLIFTAVCLAAALFVWQTIPETKDKTLEEIAELWQTETRTPELPL